MVQSEVEQKEQYRIKSAQHFTVVGKRRLFHVVGSLLVMRSCEKRCREGVSNEYMNTLTRTV